MLVGVSGIILASLMDTGQQGSAKGFELIVIAAVLLGGTSFLGGSGTIIGTILGIFILKIIDNGTTYFDFSNVPDHRTIFTNNEISGFLTLKGNRVSCNKLILTNNSGSIKNWDHFR